MNNPFDFAEGEAPVFPVTISPNIHYDLIKVYQTIWEYTHAGRPDLILKLLWSLGYLTTHSAMGNQDRLEREHRQYLDLADMSKEAHIGIDWDAEIRKMTGES